ncbi:uncharacterized protein ISCGN_010275 [Ixodes scapularis]
MAFTMVYCLEIAAAPGKLWLMTPFFSPSSAAEVAYNASHSTTRSIVERTIGQLKRRFHCLYAELRMQQRDAVTSLSPAVSCTTWPRHTLAACQGLSSPKRFPSSPWQPVVTKAQEIRSLQLLLPLCLLQEPL